MNVKCPKCNTPNSFIGEFKESNDESASQFIQRCRKCGEIIYTSQKSQKDEV